MKEIKDIIQAYNQGLKSGQQMALATVVHLQGSSYRQPGARMLITDDGQITGAISGGCLEGDTLKKAQQVMARGVSNLVTYDTVDEENSVFAIGLGCNGIVRILIEPINPEDELNPINLLKKISAARENAVVVTAFDFNSRTGPHLGTCMFHDSNGSAKSNMNLQGFEAGLAGHAKEVLAGENVIFREFNAGSKQQTAFFDLIHPPVLLVIFGAGNDVIPLVQHADILGWQTRVADGRSSYARQERFTPSCQVLLAKPEAALNDLALDDRMFFLLMSHNYDFDKAMLKTLAGSKARYVGMLGPTTKLNKMLRELENEGTVITEQFRSTIHSPVGLDIGAETPEEIAVSILAEIQKVISSRSGKSLRDLGREIHSRSDFELEEK